ncbi:MAG: hypothetical protein AAF653_18665 [Chloroflexota bacterium]
MQKYHASTPHAEVIGAALKAYETALEFDQFQHVLHEHDLTEIDAETWYPQQLTLDIQQAIKSTDGGSQMLVSVGMKIIESAKFPPMNSLEEAVNAFAASYPMNFRNQSEDDIIYADIIDAHNIRVVNASPHSDDMIYGYIYALAKRFTPEGARPVVSYEDIGKRDSDADTVFLIEY